MYVFIAANFLAIPLAILSHPTPGAVAAGVIPQLPGGLTGDLLLLIVGIVGTTVAPWQLFFQQSNVIDKRITPSWLSYARLDTVTGSVVVVAAGAAIMVAAAFAFGGNRPGRPVPGRGRRGPGHGSQPVPPPATSSRSCCSTRP